MGSGGRRDRLRFDAASFSRGVRRCIPGENGDGSCFVCVSGTVADEVLEESIRNQGAEPQDDERFQVSG